MIGAGVEGAVVCDGAVAGAVAAGGGTGATGATGGAVTPVVAGVSRSATVAVRSGQRKNAPINTMARTASAIIQPFELVRAGAAGVVVVLVVRARSRDVGGVLGS